MAHNVKGECVTDLTMGISSRYNLVSVRKILRGVGLRDQARNVRELSHSEGHKDRKWVDLAVINVAKLPET